MRHLGTIMETNSILDGILAIFALIVVIGGLWMLFSGVSGMDQK